MGKNLTELKKIADLSGEIIRWEQDDLDQTETVELFQHLIDTGLAWELQGVYGRTAKCFLDAGLCHIKDSGALDTPEEPEIPGPRRLDIIAREIREDWGAKVYFGAVPYLRAMAELGDISELYYHDTGRSVVTYFLSNATTWRGEVARRVKKELKEQLKNV